MNTGTPDMGHEMEIPLETKVRVLYLIEKEGLGCSQTGKLCGIRGSSYYKILQSRDRIKKFVFECSKMMDGGLPYLMWPELMSVKKNERETEADLRKRIKYLEAKVAYYEELSKLEGIDLGRSVKKNDAARSGPFLKEESEP